MGRQAPRRTHRCLTRLPLVDASGPGRYKHYIRDTKALGKEASLAGRKGVRRGGRLALSRLDARSPGVSICERKKELRRRRHRRKKLRQLAKRLKKATVSEKAIIAEKIRKLTPGAEAIIAAWGLEQR